MDSEVNVTNCCRTCLKIDGSLTPTSAEDTDSLKYCHKLTVFISEISWLTEGFPSLICSTCIDRLRIAYDFRSVCLESDETLRKYLENITQKNNSQRSLNTPAKFEFTTSSTKDEPYQLDNKSRQNVDHLQLKHFLESDDELIRPGNLFSKCTLRCPSPDSTSTEFISTSPPSASDQCVVEQKEHSPRQLEHGLKEQQKPNNHQQNICEISLTDSDYIPIIEQEPHLFHSIHSTGPEAVTEVTKKQIIKRTTGIQVRPRSIILEDTINNEKEEKQFTCSHCGKSYRKNANLRIHMRTHTGEKPFECRYCEKRFYHSSHLREHIRRHTGEKPFQCAVCHKRFTIKGELNMHMKSHTGEKPFACACCDRRCLTAADLKIHMRIHTGEKPFSCSICGKNFASTYILNSHIKTHTGERPYSCKQCDKTFTQSSHLNVHMRKHTGEKVFCKICATPFSHSSQLTVHMREHTGKQPYKCNICEKICNYSSELQAHMNKHTGFKFKCLTCDKRFTTLSYLHEHTRTHTGENLSTCAICERQFTRHQYLEKHMRTHTGEKPYTCFICNKAFTQSSSLNVHIRIHTGEKPFTCKICDKKFTTSSDLSSHSKQHKKYICL